MFPYEGTRTHTRNGRRGRGQRVMERRGVGESNERKSQRRSQSKRKRASEGENETEQERDSE